MKIVVVGANGYWGKNHVRTLKQIGVDVITCDVSGNVDHNDYTDIRKCDGIVIATQPEYHLDIALYFMIHKIPVLIEKPMVIGMDEVAAIKMLYSENGDEPFVQTGHTYIYHPAIDYIKKAIDSGELGTIHYINCDWKNLGLFQKSGVIWDLAPHPLSIILYLVGSDNYTAEHFASSHVVDGVEDTAHINLSFGDIDASINLSWIDPMKTRKITVVGSRKMIVFDDTEPLDKIKIYDKACVFHDKSDDFGTWHMSYKYGDTLMPKLENKEPLKEELEDFIWCIRDRKRKPKSGLQLGAQVVQIIEGLRRKSS